MAGRSIWAKQAEEAKLKEEEQKAAAARAAFDATFKGTESVAKNSLELMNIEQASGRSRSRSRSRSRNSNEEEKDGSDDDSEEDEEERLSNKPIGPVDPSKCTAAGSGVAGGAAGSTASFIIITKDADGRRVLRGGAQIKVKVVPGMSTISVGGVEQEAVVKDHGDGTYAVSYAVVKRGDYTVSVECNGLPILNSPFPVFFSGGTGLPLPTPPSGGIGNGIGGGMGPLLASPPFINGSAQPAFPGMMPNMFGTNFPGLLQAGMPFFFTCLIISKFQYFILLFMGMFFSCV